MNDFVIYLIASAVGIVCFWMGVGIGSHGKPKFELFVIMIITVLCFICFWVGVGIGATW